MNEKPNEWVAVADLMSGVLAVVALMLVAAILLSRQQAEAHMAEIQKPGAKGRVEIGRVLTVFERGNKNPSIRVDVAGGRILLTDEAFDNASACLQKKARHSLEALRESFPQQLLAKNVDFDITVRIEGHTDSNVVEGPIRDAGHCAVYSDNVELSVARASEARKVLITGLNPEAARRFVVAGFGDTHPLEQQNPADARNRRVEVLFSAEEPRSSSKTGAQAAVSNFVSRPQPAASAALVPPGIDSRTSNAFSG